ncbi:TIGR00730 family Rossman fold protein [Candidatus Kapaibacterium sp.]
MKNVTVFCGSSNNVDSKYLNDACFLGQKLALFGCNIIFGGGKVGSMGALAEGALSNNCNVIGIIPDFMIEKELAHPDIKQMIVVKSMHERQLLMINKSDVIVVLPGGNGTMAELFEAITWNKLGIISKKILIHNKDGYYNSLLEFIDKAIHEKFMKTEDKNICLVFDDISSIITYIYNLEHSIFELDLA